MASERLEKMRAAVGALYERNRQQGRASWCEKGYDFVCPSAGTYPFQWLWDSCFHTVALSHLDPERAASEVRSLLENQQPDGFVAHVTFWQRERYEEMLKTYSIAYRTPYLSDCMQPPVLVEAIAAAYRRGAGRPFLEEVLPKARAFCDWLDRVRDPDDDGLIATLQPDESGLDHTPKYDAYLGIENVALADFTAAWERVVAPYTEVEREPARMFAADSFVCEDVLVNTIYALNQETLAELYDEVGDEAGAAELRRRAERTRAALLEKCFDDERGLFFDLAGSDERMLKVSTVSSLLPLALPQLDEDVARRLIAHLEDPGEFGTEYPVPSTALSEPGFAPGTVGGKLVWRGPSWINTNWYLQRGLAAHGREDLAHRLADRSAALVEQSGFREYYNPHTGEGHGAEDFSWSALALDMLTWSEQSR